MLLSNYNYDNCRLFSYVPLLVLYEKKKKKKSLLVLLLLMNVKGSMQ